VRVQAVLLAILVFCIVTMPYVFAAWIASPERVFGGFLLNPIDGNSYLAKMFEGWRGEWRFTLPYTANPGRGAYLFLFYIFLGHMARLTSLSLLFTFHLVRLIASLFLFYSLYRFLTGALPQVNRTIWIYAMAMLGAGMGWMAIPFRAFTSDFWVAETFPFLSSYSNPHFPLGLGLLLWMLTTSKHTGKVGKEGKSSNDWLNAFLAFLLAVIAPFGVVIALAILGGLALWELWSFRKSEMGIAISTQQKQPRGKINWINNFSSSTSLRRFLWVMLGGGPLMLYDLWVVRVDPILAGWNIQNITPSPPIWDLAISLSPALILAIPGAWLAWKQDVISSKSRVLLVWVSLGFLLLYLPLGLQRRFMMGLFVPVVGLGGLGIEWIAKRIGKRANLLATVVLVLSVPTNLLVLLSAMHGILTHDPLLYMTQGEAQALNWIDENTPTDALILAAPETGLLIPSHTGRRVLYGHPFETINAEVEKATLISFFEKAGDSNTLPVAKALFIQRGIDYVFYGPREQTLGSLPHMDQLRLVYSEGGVSIYQILVIE
jgi:hypothetical protein